MVKLTWDEVFAGLPASLAGEHVLIGVDYGLDMDRGSGRTWRQMRALPDGGVFVVARKAELGHCQRILAAQGRSIEALTLVVLDEAHDLIRARYPCQFTVDHAAVMTEEQFALLMPYDW